MPEIRYVTLIDAENPVLLARIRWPDVADAISLGCSEWQCDPGLFDLPYDASSAEVSRERAEEIAAGWGVSLPDGSSIPDSQPSLIRRMPANWSNLASAERKAWSLERSRVRGRNRRRRGRHSARKAPGRSGGQPSASRRTPSASSSAPQDPHLGPITEDGFLPAIDSLARLVPADAPEAASPTPDRPPATVPSVDDPDGAEGLPDWRDVRSDDARPDAPFANLHDPRLAGLRYPVGRTRPTTRPEPDPSPPSRPRPGVR